MEIVPLLPPYPMQPVLLGDLVKYNSPLHIIMDV
jgi:hypothetical protein